MNEALKKTFSPEFLNRVDEIIMFGNLNKDHIERIAKLMLKELAQRTADMGIEVTITPAAIEFIAKSGYDEANGARPLRRTITRLAEDRLADEILKGNFTRGDKIQMISDGEKIDFIKLSD